MIDFASQVLGPIYSAWGVAATFVSADGHPPVALRVLDKTRGAAWGGDGPEVQSLKPLATVRMAELTERGLSVDDLDDGVLTCNGAEWRVQAHMTKPVAVGGESAGEIDLLLNEHSE